MEPIQNAPQNDSVHVECVEKLGNLDGRTVQNISDSKKEAQSMSGIVYALAAFIFTISIYLASDRKWSQAGVVLVAGTLMGILGRLMHQAVLDANNH